MAELAAVEARATAAAATALGRVGAFSLAVTELATPEAGIAAAVGALTLAVTGLATVEAVDTVRILV